MSHFARFNCLYSHHPVHSRFWIEDFREAPRTGKPFLVKPIHGKVSRQSVWGLTVPVIGAVAPTHPAPAIVVTPPGGEPPNRVEAEKHISYALTASSVAPVQDRACALELVEFAPEALARDVLPTRRDGSMWTQSDYGLTPYWAARVKKQFGKNPDVDAFNRVPGMAQATRWVSPLEDFFSTPADPSKLYWMCPPYHRFSDCVRKIRQEKLRAIVVGPKWTHREWWKPLMEITLQGYHLPGPETKACLYQNDHLTPLPQRGWSTVALYVDGGIAEENLAATKCHVASVLAPAVSNPNTDGEPGMTSEEESEDERVPNHLASVRTLTYQATHKKLLAPVTLDPTPEDLEAQECVRSRIAKIERELLGGRATTVKRYRKRKGATRLLAASRVGGVVTTQEPIVSPEVELMRKRILADYERDVFSGEVRLRPDQEHPKVRGTERLGFAKLDLYPNAKPKSVKPIRLVGERAAAEQEIVEDFLARGWIEPCPASEWASNGFVVPKKEKGKWRLVVDYRQLNEATLPDAHPLPLIENMLENQSKHKIFTIVDLSKGFHQIPLHPESRAKTAMNLAGKRYQWRAMPMGIKNGPAIFQRVMDHVLQGLDCADVYIDDIIIGSSGATEEELLANHDRDVRAVLDRLRKEELVASVSKTDFFVRSVEFCGHVLENGTRRPAPGKMLALERWDKPDNVRELRGFLGLANYYSGYVQHYASIATPLINMLKDLPKHKNGKKIGLTWNASANEAFLKLKRAITDIVPLQLADWDKDFVLTPDASNWAVGAALQQEGPDGALRPLAFFSRKLSGSQLNWSPREKECYAIVAALLKWHGWVGNKRVEVRTDHRSLENWATEDLKTVGGPSPRQARWHELFSKFDLHVVYTPGPVNPVGDFLSRWAYPANPALGDVSIHGTAQAAGDVRDMMAAEKEELLAHPLVFRAVVAPVVIRSKAAPRAQGAPACDPPPLASPPVGGGTKQKRKLRRLERIVKIKKSWKSHKKATPIHGEDAPNVIEINWAKHYPNCQRYKQMWQDALNGSFQDGVRLVDNKLVRNGRWCVPTPLVHRLVAEYHDAFHLTTSSVEKHWKEINHGVEGEGLYKAVELQCQTCPSCAIHTHDTKRKQGYMTPMPIPMEPMDSIALDVFHYPSTSHDGEVYDRMLLCVCRLSGYLIAIPIPKPRHGDKDEGLTGRRAAHLVMERWVDRFGAPREICSDRGPQFVSQYFQTLCSKIGARSTMCLAGRHQGNGKAENTGKQLRRAVAKAITLKRKKTNWVEVLPAVVRAWHETTGPSGYTPNEIVFGKHNRTKGPPLAEPKGVAQDAAHYFQRREELIALARRAMIQVQETMARKYNKSRRMSPNFSKGDRVWVRRQRKNLGDKTCPYWDGPYEVVAKKAHDLYVIQVDQRRLVDVHVDCLMKTVNSPRSPVPLNYTEEVARVPSQFEEDTYNVKKILSHRTYRKRLLFKVRWEGYTKDWDTEEPVETFLPSYNKVWRDYLQKQNLTQTVDILAHLGGPLS